MTILLNHSLRIRIFEFKLSTIKKSTEIRSLFSFVAIAVFIAITFLVGAKFTPQTDAYFTLGAWGVLFALYFLFNQFLLNNVQPLIVVGIIARVILIPFLPELNKDFYRYYWDGHLMLNNISPYAYTPNELLQLNRIPEVLQSVLSFLPNRDSFSNYPPLAQYVFGLAAIMTDSIDSFVIYLKVLLFLLEVSTILIMVQLLKSFKLSISNVLFYVLNPLVIIGIMGNMYLDGILIFLTTIFLYLLSVSRGWLGFIPYTFSLLFNPITLLFLPYLVKRLTTKVFILFVILCSALLAISFIPICHFSEIPNMLLSIKKVQLEQGFCSPFRLLADWFMTKNNIQFQYLNWVVYSAIGIVVLMLSVKEKINTERYLPASLMIALTVFLTLKLNVDITTITLLLFMSVFTNYRYPLVLSFISAFLILTKEAFSPDLNAVLFAVGYMVVGIVIFYEILFKERAINPY